MPEAYSITQEERNRRDQHEALVSRLAAARKEIDHQKAIMSLKDRDKAALVRMLQVWMATVNPETANDAALKRLLDSQAVIARHARGVKL